MPRTIACGVDDSDAAHAVAGTARWLANRLQARLMLIHVVGEPARESEAVLASLRVHLGLGERDEIRLLAGVPADRLIERADEDGAELLVVGSRGRGSIRSAVLGSVSRTLATSARCPVAIVPPGSPDRAATDGHESGEASIVCGVDGSEHALAAARLAADLAVRMELRLVLVHALSDLKSLASYPGARSTAPPLSGQPDTRARLAAQMVDEAVAAVGGRATGVVDEGRPWDVLESVADREAARLLVVAARGLGGLRTALFGSVASELAASSRRPVIVLPERAETRT
jgi:nucleotide-binding universal stress UspA family protein